MRRKINSIPTPLRPREKLLARGPTSLSLKELLVTLFITGSKSKSVTQLATVLEKIYLSGKIPDKQVIEKLSFGPAKTAQILSLFELIIRYKEPKRSVAHSGDHIYLQSQDILSDQKETLVCFYLNARGEILNRETIAVGNLNTVRVLPVEIFHVIRDMPVASIILVHNHPSGELDPSREDILFTKRVEKAAEILGITLLDHLIITRSGWKAVY